MKGFLVPASLVLASVLALSACSSAPEQQINTAPPGAMTQPTDVDSDDQVSPNCNAQAVKSYNGRQGSTQLYGEMLQKSGARIQRVLTPQSVMTMDYRNDRLDIRLDDQGRISSSTCG